MYQESNTSSASGLQSLSNVELVEVATARAEQRLNEQILEAVRAMDVEWKAAHKPMLLLGSAAMVMPCALTLLMLTMLLPVDTTQLWTLLISASVLFYAVVELAWRGHQAMPRPPLQRLIERLSKRSLSARAVVQ